MQLVRERNQPFDNEIGKIEFAEGQTKSLELDIGDLNTQLALRFKFDFTGTATPLTTYGRCLDMIRQLRVTLNDRDDVYRLAGRHMVAHYVTDYRGLPVGFDPVPGAAGSVEFVWTIDFQNLNSMDTQMSALDLRTRGPLRNRKLKDAKLHIDWNTFNAIRTGAEDMECDITCHVSQHAIRNWQSPIIGRGKRRADGTRPVRRRNPAVRFFEISEHDPVTANQFDFELARFDDRARWTELKALHILTTVSSASDPRRIGSDNALQNYIEVRAGNTSVSKTHVKTARQRYAQNRDHFVSKGLITIPAANLFETNGYYDLHRLGPDIELIADITTDQLAPGEMYNVEVIAEVLRQETL